MAIGSEYLLKITPKSVCPSEFIWRSTLLGLLLEECVYGALRVASDYKTGIFGKATMGKRYGVSSLRKRRGLQDDRT